MFALTVLSLLAVIPDPTEKWPEVARKELKALQGRWKVEKNIVGGNEVVPDEDQVVEIKGRFLLADGEVEAEFAALDPQTSPKCVDVRTRDSDRKDAVMEGVYKLDGDTLTLCVYLGAGKNRPGGFEAKDEFVVVVLKRTKK